MPRAEFEKLVDEGLQRLPQWVREKIKNVALLIEDEPSDELRKKEGLQQNETLLGYYHGVPLAHRGESYGLGMTMPDTITLFQIPIEEAADTDEKDVRDVVAETIWHEFGHYFGMSEQEVRRREQLRGNRGIV
jgi:predicted Zn-dependent protease with MMP-like domain